MSTLRRNFSLCIVVAFTISLTGCSIFRGGPSAESRLSEGAKIDYAAELDAMVKRYIRSSLNHSSPASADFVTNKPDFFKEYVSYPQGEEEFDVEIRERESLSAPYQALVKVPKIRYATPIAKSRDAARRETRFIKSTGTETISFEYRSSRWYRMGSFFVADTTEIQVGDQWTPVETSSISTEGVSTEDDQEGFWGRTWRRMKIWQR
jgi:hypothetical protein